jgi:hypothetical protein
LPTPQISGIQNPSNVQKANVSQQLLIIAVFLTENRNLNIYRFEKYHFITMPLILTKFRCCARNEYTAIPLQAWRGPEGSRRLRLPDFKTIGT